MAYMYTRPERLADGTIHVLGIGTSICGAALLVAYALRTQSTADIVAVSIYCSLVIFAFSVSAIYHMTPWIRVRPLLQRVDHAAIYLKIAATYTPLTVIIDTAFAYGVLGAVWTLAAAGAIGKLTQFLKPGAVSTFVYIAMGWGAVVLIWPLMNSVPPSSLALMVAGGFLYTVGAPFNHWETLRFNTAIWHGFVLTASALYFAAIALALATP